MRIGGTEDPIQIPGILRGLPEHQKVLGQEDALDVVDVALKDREAGMAALRHQGDDLLQRGLVLHPHHLQAGHHDFPNESISEFKDTLDQFAFLPGDEPLLLTRVDDVLDFTLL